MGVFDTARNRMIGYSIVLTVLVAASAAGPSAASKGPDAGGYTVTDATVYSFVDIAGASGGTAILQGIDDGTAVLRIPFAFQFYGQQYTFVCVSTNGALYFVSGAAACAGFNDFANTDISSTSTPNDLPALLPFWSDLTFEVPGAGAVFYQTAGAPSARRFIVQWNDAFPLGSSSPVTFQAILSEGTNTILFQYKAVGLGPGSPATNGALATVGVRNAGALSNKQELAWSFDVPVIADQSALLFNGDSTAPVTEAAFNGPAGSNGWYLGDVQVTLTARDPDSPATTYYSVDGGGTVRYSAPFTIAADGVHRLAYFSRDPAGNQEAQHLVDVRIDSTRPTVTARATPSQLFPPNNKPVDVAVDGTVADAQSTIDATSGHFTVIDSYGLVQPTGNFTIASNGSYAFTASLVASRRPDESPERIYTVVVAIKDTAGNLSSTTTRVIVPIHPRLMVQDRFSPAFDGRRSEASSAFFRLAPHR